MTAVEFLSVVQVQCFPATLLTSSNDDRAHPIYSRAIDGYVPMLPNVLSITKVGKRNERDDKKKTKINSDEVHVMCLINFRT